MDLLLQGSVTELQHHGNGKGRKDAGAYFSGVGF